MRSLPPPRRSRARSFKRFLRYLYRLMTLQLLFRQRSTVVIKRRLWPFHRSSRRYKVKQRGKREHWYHMNRVRGSVVLDARVLGELARELELGNVTLTKKKKSRVRSILRLRVVARRLFGWARARRWHLRHEHQFRAVVVQ